MLAAQQRQHHYYDFKLMGRMGSVALKLDVLAGMSRVHPVLRVWVAALHKIQGEKDEE